MCASCRKDRTATRKQWRNHLRQVTPSRPPARGHLAETSRHRYSDSTAVWPAEGPERSPRGHCGSRHDHATPSRRDEQMSAPQYRKVAALALAAGLGLGFAACSTKSVSVGAQCDNPPDFTARLQGGTMTDVFYAYMTDLGQVLDSGKAMDITQYVSKDTIPTWDSIDAGAKAVFSDNGKVYGIPTKNYSMGLVYNKTLFQKAGLDPKNPPKTWSEVREAAKKISALGNGISGYSDYSAGNTGGWHFTAELYSHGGQMVSADGKKASFNNDMGKKVLQNLKDMRYTDNSMGDKQLLGWPDLLTNAGAGKVGMFVGAQDATTAIVTQFQGKYQDWAMGPLPGADGPAKGTLGGGEGYFFKKGLTEIG